MGTTPGGFLSGLFGQIGPRLQEKHDQELALQTQKKKGEYDTYWNSMQAAATRLSQLKSKGDLSPEEEKEAQGLASQYSWSEQQLNKMTKGSKPLGEAFQKVGGFVKQILSHPSPKGQLQAPGQAQSGQQQPPQQAAAQPQAGQAGQAGQQQPSQPLQPPPMPAKPADAPSMQGAMALSQSMSPDAVKQRNAESDRTRRRKTGKDAGLTGRDLAEFEETGKLPSQAASATRQAKRVKLTDGSEMDVQWDPKTGAFYDNQNEPFQFPDGAQLMAAPKATGRPTIIASDYVNMEDAKKLKEGGASLVGEDGKEIDLEKVPDRMVLQRVHIGDKTVYQPRNINDKIVTFGNVRYAVNPSQVQQIPQGAGTALGQANTGATSTHEVITEDPQGNTTATRLNSTRTPVTTPLPGRTPPAAGSPAAPAGQAAPKTSAQPGGGRPSASATPGSRVIGSMTPGQAEHVRSRLIPVREAATQLFGDTTQPDFKGLISFSKLADDKATRERLGKAFKLTLDWMNEASGGSHISAGAGPVSVNAGGGPIEWIENYFNVPPAVAAQRAGIMQQAIGDLKPEEQEAYNATMSAFGTIVGLRSLTKASAAQASVRTIEREMPIIGVNSVNSRQFNDQMARLAEQVYNGVKGINPAVVEAQNPGLMERIKGLPAEMKKLRGGPSPNGTLTPPGTLPKPAKQGEAASESAMKAYLAANGGDVAKTRKALTDAGYTIPAK